jgi:hypothetical protein
VLSAAATFVLLIAAGVAFVGLAIVVLPTRYFVDERPFWRDKPPLVRVLGIVGKNLLGLSLVALGVALSIPGIPGQGILTILIGLVLVDFPYKRRLVRNLAQRPWIQRSLNQFRIRLGRPPLEFESQCSS